MSFWKNRLDQNTNEKFEKKISSRTIFFQPGKIFFPIFPGATLQKNNEISNQNNLLGLRKDRKYLEKRLD